ncbi:LytR family transcriptional regulator [Corynebacterium sp. 3HC-13]|uniref:LCP family protein n=1 Tax=Corynebacterium poyangense TaxID=2684405 RepID=UPI001CCC04A3|nr:LCP family protein [Corynebacterium poyangense]MBZ8176685.1 LytR family transcriptional regulator [Corynebacterium poyangense]
MDDIARDRNGNPIYDRYGRPVRRRAARPAQAPRPQRAQQQQPPRRLTPQQRFPVPTPRPERPVPTPRPERPMARPPFQRRRLPRPQGCGCSLKALIPLLLVLLLVTTLWVDTQLNRVDALPTHQVPNTSGTNWLLVGSDSRQGLSEADIQRLGTGGDIGTGRTDTIMLLHIPRLGGGKPTLVSIPRDSYVPIPGHGSAKINAAFAYGGPQLLVETVEQSTGLRIDHYAEIGMGGLANVVDSVGGVQICVKEAINDPLANLNVSAGCQKMNGPTALGYVRTRATAEGDLDRVVRQRQFLSALLDKATSPWTLLNPFRMLPLIMHTAATFSVDRGDHVWHLARLAWAMRSSPETKTVPISGFANYDVGSVVLWDDNASAQLWNSLR